MLCIASVASPLQRKAPAASDLDPTQPTFQAASYAEALAPAARPAADLVRERHGLEERLHSELETGAGTGHLEHARELARGYARPHSGGSVCGGGRGVARVRGPREEAFKAFRLAWVGQPDAAD